MAATDGVVSRATLLNDEWARETSRKDSLEKRGITVITTSGVLVTLIFAFTSAVAKGNSLGNFTLGEKIAIAIALLFFVISAAFGIATNTPRNYAGVDYETLKQISTNETPQTPITELMWSDLVDALATSRSRNDTKAAALSLSIVFQTIAIFVVAVTVMIVII
jgi:hypothetical protein